MKLHLSIHQIATIISSKNACESSELIEVIAFDSRKIINASATLFFALKGEFRDGHSFIAAAYAKGIRYFVVEENVAENSFPEALFLYVSNTLKSLQQLARYHRSQFNIPVIAITGSVGKTTVKEWIYHLISDQFQVVRSPKSYNSQLGVALSLLEINENHQIALIEAGISKPAEMQFLAEMICPTIGVFTAFGSAHASNFNSPAQHLAEKLFLFSSCKTTLVPASIQLNSMQLSTINAQSVAPDFANDYIALSPFQDKASIENLRMSIALAKLIGIDEVDLKSKIKTLPRLALRMETFDGINGNLIINDSYNLDLDALHQSLEYQISIANGKKRVAIIATEMLSDEKRVALKKTIEKFRLDGLFLVDQTTQIPLDTIQNSVVLIKGTRASQSQKIAAKFQLKKHKTRVEIDFSAIKHNLNYFRSLTQKGTKILVMVKASSYGSGAEKMAEFLEKSGVEYLGVAYADEGVELRRQGIQLPILVMNAEEAGFQDIIEFKLAPAIYSFAQLDQFVKALIMQNKEQYPVHLKIDTGMKRLGFLPNEVPKVLDFIQAQPEIFIQGVYSHLADADNLSSNTFSVDQINLFETITQTLKQKLGYSFIRHILNTEGITQFPTANYEMVRMGIGLYGYATSSQIQSHLQPAISWKSMVSQVKQIEIGESVGYNRKFVAQVPTQIAVIPVGYADGFRRSLSMGKGGVYIHNTWCPVVGSVCMDMIMVDVTAVPVCEGDEVEIIGANQSLTDFAKRMDTIAYEVLTSISKRVQRIYLEA